MTTNKNNKIAVLVVYYGKFPPSIIMWADSAKYQKHIDFIFVTDQEQPLYLKEFKWITIPFVDLVIKINTSLDMEVALKSPYKICDFRPAFGIIFSEYLRDFDYWGYCDLDLIWGNLNLILDKGLIMSPDLLYSRGHFTLYKNSEEINNLFRSKISIVNGVTDYKEIFAQEESCLFDETYGAFKLFRKKKKVVYHNKNFIDIKANSINFSASNIKNHYVQFFVYHKGHIYQLCKKNWLSFSLEYKQYQYSYIHFQKRKINFSEFKEPDNFYLITSKKIIAFNSFNEIVNSKKVLFDFNLLHYLKRFNDRLLKKIKIRKSTFNNYLNTNNDY
jgi:hypothetical protein